MTETSGIVVRLEGGDAWVRAAGQGKTCGACAQQDSCPSSGSGGLLGGVPGQEQGSAKLLRLPNIIHARPGDAVVICAAEGVVLRAVWIAYGMPLALGLLGALAGKTWFVNELAVFAGMLLGLATGFLALRWRGLDRGDKEPILSIGFKRTP